MSNNKVSEVSEEVPERIWVHQVARNVKVIHSERKSDTDVEYVRASPVTVDEAAVRRAAEKIQEYTVTAILRAKHGKLLTAEEEVAQFAETIATELRVSSNQNLVSPKPTTPLANVERSLLPTQESGLLPCPFCGTTPTLVAENEFNWFVGCGLPGCFVRPKSPMTFRQSAIAYWNTRVSYDASDLRRALKAIRDSQETDLGLYAKFCQATAAEALGQTTRGSN